LANKKKYRTVSLPWGVAEAIERLIEELGYWPSTGAFAREACIKMIREEWPRLETEEKPPEKDTMKGHKRRASKLNNE